MIAIPQTIISVGRQTQAGQKALTTINCSCNNNPGSPTGFALANKTFKALECKLVKLATEKQQLALANQIRLAELELVNLRRGMPLSSPTIDKLPRHTQACNISNVNGSPLHTKPRSVKNY